MRCGSWAGHTPKRVRSCTSRTPITSLGPGSKVRRESGLPQSLRSIPEPKVRRESSQPQSLQPSQGRLAKTLLRAQPWPPPLPGRTVSLDSRSKAPPPAPRVGGPAPFRPRSSCRREGGRLETVQHPVHPPRRREAATPCANLSAVSAQSIYSQNGRLQQGSKPRCRS